jgi:hypothetical protein
MRAHEQSDHTNTVGGGSTPRTAGAGARKRQRRRTVPHAPELVELLGRRTDLRGAYYFADVLDEVVRWGV